MQGFLSVASPPIIVACRLDIWYGMGRKDDGTSCLLDPCTQLHPSPLQPSSSVYYIIHAFKV